MVLIDPFDDPAASYVVVDRGGRLEVRPDFGRSATGLYVVYGPDSLPGCQDYLSERTVAPGSTRADTTAQDAAAQAGPSGSDEPVPGQR